MKAVLAWALFDFANTFFAVAMLSFHFPLWVVEDRGAKELVFSLTLAISMACVAVAMPFCGALSDATGERMRFLRWTTYACAAATLLIGLTPHLWLALVLFGVANVCYQLGTIFYDALLWSVAATGRLGQTSGLGAAFGYLGSMMGLLLLWPFANSGGHQATFAPSAGLFLLFALPSFLMIREHPKPALQAGWLGIIQMASLRLAMTVRSAQALAGLWRYLWASFFSSNAINTILVFMAVYTKRVVGFTEGQVIQFFLFSQSFAVAGSMACGAMMPRWGAKRTLSWIWSGWAAALGLVLAASPARWIWVVGPIMGFCLGSTWATSRVLVMDLSPKDQLAEMFGLAGLFARASAIIGPMLWGLLVWNPTQYRHAVALLIGLLGIGLWLLRGVPDPHPEKA